MSTLRAVMTASALLVLPACGPSDAPPSDADRPQAEAEAATVPEWVTRVAVIANAIEDRPAAFDSILTAHDMTREAFESRIYDIAADPVLTAAYERTRGR
ncbi:MAG: hypothetical protein RQ745_04860 [Longimicrobiales bacterium]|nr:hypothetical protein [Longimicrobiales bacterium]